MAAWKTLKLVGHVPSLAYAGGNCSPDNYSARVLRFSHELNAGILRLILLLTITVSDYLTRR
jgi:hypothetical protein